MRKTNRRYLRCLAVILWVGLWTVCQERPLKSEGTLTPAPPVTKGIKQSYTQEIQAAAAVLAQIKDPFVQWLTGKQQSEATMPARVDRLLKAAAPLEKSIYKNFSHYVRKPKEMVFGWRFQVAHPNGSCEPPMAKIEGDVKKNEFTAVTPENLYLVADTDRYGSTKGKKIQVAYEYKGPGQKLRLEAVCVPTYILQCTGGNCPRRIPTTIHLAFRFSLAANAFGTLNEAFALFPPLNKDVQPDKLPQFLINRMEQSGLKNISCDGWNKGVACQEFNFKVQPAEDFGQWVLRTIELAQKYGFLCEERHKDPKKEWLTSFQKCSNRYLYYQADPAEVTVRLVPPLGGSAEDTVSRCSDKHFKEKPGSEPAASVVEKVLDVLIKKPHFKHLEKLRTCYENHRKKSGGITERIQWKKGGNFLYFYQVDKGEWPEGNPERIKPGHFQAEFSFYHIPYSQKPAIRYFIRSNLKTADNIVAELYCPIEPEYRGGYCDLKIEDKYPFRFSFRLPVADSPKPLESLANFKTLAFAKVKTAYERDLAGFKHMTKCKLLPNRGCETVPATEQDKAQARKNYIQHHQKRIHLLTENIKKYHTLALKLFPLGDPDCSVRVPKE